MEETLRELTEIIRIYCNQRDSWQDYVAIILSALAIVISIYTVYYERKINNNNLQADYYKEIFGEYLKKTIPEAGCKLSYDLNGKLNKSYKNVTTMFFEMYTHCGYFKYVDNDFYTELKNEIMKFDELTVNMAAETIVDIETQRKNLIEIHRQIENIVQLINRQYQKI